jgi:hypothetical protein
MNCFSTVSNFIFKLRGIISQSKIAPQNILVISANEKYILVSHDTGCLTAYFAPVPSKSETSVVTVAKRKSNFSFTSMLGFKSTTPEEQSRSVHQVCTRSVKSLFELKSVVEDLNGPAWRISSL